MLAPSAALRARQGQLIISSPRQRLGAARAPWVRRAAAHGPRAEQPPPSGPSSLAADSVGSAASLERMYLLTAHDGAAPLVLLQAAARQQQPEAKQQQQQQQQPEGPPPEGPQHHLHVTEVCGSGGAGLHVCVEHTVNEDGHEVLPAEPLPGPEGALARLLDRMPLSRRARGIVMLNLLVLLVATNWVVVKDVGNQFDAFGFAFLRFGVAAIAFSPFLKGAAKDMRIVSAGVELGVWTAAGYITQAVGLLTTDASRASFLSTFTVLVVPLLVGLSGRGVSPVTWASCVAALAGVGLLEQGGAPPGIGDVWSMVSAVAFGFQMFRTEHHARILGNSNNLPLMSVVLATTMVCAGGAAAVVHPGAVAEWVQNPGALQAIFTSGTFPWQQVLYCGLLTTDLALLLELLALQDVSSVEAAIIYTLEPVLGAALAWWMLGERLGAKGLAGAAIILASSLVTQLAGAGEEPLPPPPPPGAAPPPQLAAEKVKAE